MIKKIVFLLLFYSCFWAGAQTCPTVTYPSNGDVNIPVNPTITWTEVTGINGYLISVGTFSGGTDILNGKPLGVTNFYTPPLGFPDNTTLYVSISLIPFDGPPIKCQEFIFTTVAVTSSPPCTLLVAPDNNAASVTIITDIVWAYAPSATGYLLSMGTQPNGTDILNRLDVGNTLSYDPPTDLPQNQTIYVTILSYNRLGTTEGCTEEYFTTSTSINSCDPVLDEATGTIIIRKPDIDFPSIVGICSGGLPYIISTDGIADGFRWYFTNSGSAEELLSENRQVGITQPGRYRFEAYNLILTEDGTIECTTSKLFDVLASEAATIEAVSVQNFVDGKTIIISVSGSGQYEYALDNPEGSYQDIPVFTGIPPGPHLVYVRDKNGCGITARNVDRDLSADDFPAFFTPNNDGYNDFWQFVPPPENYEEVLKEILIFDRYGNLVKQLLPSDPGWDGTSLGNVLPPSDYWFRAIFSNNQQIKGHFTLKR